MNTEEKGRQKKRPILPKSTLPTSVVEELIREELKKLTENSEEIRKLRERIKKLSMEDGHIEKEDGETV